MRPIKLEIKSLKGKRFAFPDGVYRYQSGHALYCESLGFLGWIDNPYEPYSPSIKALEEILATGGLINYESNVWIKEC